MKNWVVSAKRADFNEISKKYNITPMLARIIRNRDIVEDSEINMFLNGTLSDMHNPMLLKDMDKAVEMIYASIKSKEKIMIIGDYDIDGVCSSYILQKGISELGGNSFVRLPDRIIDGYGMNKSMIDEAHEKAVNLIITCDNGISAYNETEYAKSLGIKVVITDHHEVPYNEENGVKKYVLPPADAVIDPKQEECEYPFKEICGGMVAYKVIQYIISKYGINSDILNELLMFAAFATVGDVMPLLNENRICVKYGLNYIKSTSNHGMNALIDVTGIDRTKIAPYHIGFILGPCINASGRLDSAERALNMFFCADYESALTIASELKDLNDSRKDLTVKYTDEAVGQILSNPAYLDERILVIYLKDCHESLAGIIAGRIKERFYKPTFVLTGCGDNVKGSGRSIDSYNMYEEMSKCNELFSKYGGHKMAAGLSMNECDIDCFRERINTVCELSNDDLVEKIVIDIPMPIEYATMKFAREIDKLEPYGIGNSKPLFAQKDLYVSNVNVIGKNRNAVKLNLRTNNNCMAEAICFGDGDEIAKDLTTKGIISAVYEIGINKYNGRENVQLVLKDWK